MTHTSRPECVCLHLACTFRLDGHCCDSRRVGDTCPGAHADVSKDTQIINTSKLRGLREAIAERRAEAGEPRR
jgi:hypothetical protein